MGLVSSSSVNSDITKNPYNFAPFNVSHIQLSSDVHTNLRPFKINTAKNEFLEAYLSIFESSNIKFGDSGNTITRKDFLNGTFLLGWDLTNGI